MAVPFRTGKKPRAWLASRMSCLACVHVRLDASAAALAAAVASWTVSKVSFALRLVGQGLVEESWQLCRRAIARAAIVDPGVVVFPLVVVFLVVVPR